MAGEAHWFPIVIVVLGALCLVTLAWFGVVYSKRWRIGEQQLRCPETGEDTRCLVYEDTATGKLMHVVDCARLNSEGLPSCRDACLAERNPA